eukprot:3398300-Prymnesium_polylepis.1
MRARPAEAASGGVRAHLVDEVGHVRLRQHVHVGVHAAIQVEHGVPPHVGALHARLESIVHLEVVRLAGDADKLIDVLAAARVVRDPQLEAQLLPALPPFRLGARE